MNTIPNDYKSHLEKVVADLYKKFDEEDEKRKSLKIADNNYLKIEKKLSELINLFEKNNIPDSIQVLEKLTAYKTPQCELKNTANMA